MNTNFKVIGLAQLGIKPKSTAPKTTLSSRPSKQMKLLDDLKPGVYCFQVTTFFKRILHWLVHSLTTRFCEILIINLATSAVADKFSFFIVQTIYLIKEFKVLRKKIKDFTSAV